MKSTGTTRILERPERSRLFRAAARVLIFALPTLLAPPAQAAPRPVSVPAPAVRWAPPPVPVALETPAAAAPAWPAARAAVPSRVPAPPPLAPPRTATAPDVGRTPAERADTPLPERRVEDDPRLRRLPSARLPWLHAPGEALLAALAATPSAGDAPALVREATLPAGWSLVSVPLLAGNTQASSVFGALPAPPRVYDYADGRTLGIGEPGFRTVVPGRAFWVVLSQPQALSLSGLAINPTVEARLPLSPGWNTVATPWLSGVEWTDARVSVRVGSETVPLGEAVARGWIGSDLYQYDPATAGFVSFAANASPAGELRVWEGSAVFASVTGELVLQPPPPDTQPPAISLSPPPVEGQEITAPLDIVGTIDDPNLAEWRLELAPAGTSTYTTFAAGSTPVTNGVLGTLDPTGLLNGQYQVRLVATDTFGQSSIIAWTVVVKGDLKIGNFSMSFVDLEVPVAGLPIRVTRTYDSRDKGRGDFGIGWRLELSDARLDENGALGDHWTGTSSGGIFPTYCLQPTRNHKVSITLPDGEVYQFEPTVTPQCQFLIPILDVTLGFRPLPGTLGSLQPLDVTSALPAVGWPGPGTLIDYGGGGAADPDLYRLTLKDGRAFVIHQQNGLQSITDLNGNQLTLGPGGIVHNSGTGVVFTRDGLGRITRITDPAGNVLTYAYDAAGDLAGSTDRESQLTTYTYNGSHGLLSISDPLGRQPIRNDYDASGRLVKHTDASGRTIEYSHDVVGRQEIVKDREGRLTVLEYDERGNVIKQIDPEGLVSTRTFDARGNKLSETDPSGATTAWTYDANDNVTSVTDPQGHVTASAFDARGKLLSSTDALGRTTANEYDARGNVTRTTDAAGNATTQTYDARGNVLTRTVTVGGVARTTSYQYDANGRVTRETDAAGHATTFTYDGAGNRLTRATTRTLPGGGTETLTIAYEYDREGRLMRTVDPDGSVTRLVYDAVGRVVEAYDKLSRRTTYEYDANGRLLKTSYPDSTFEQLTHDGEGRRTSVRDRSGRVTTYAYDGNGRPVRTTYADGTFSTTSYDAAGRVTATTDARGATTTYAYDSLGRRTSVRDALGNETLFTYDAVGNQLTLRDARGNLTTHEYDALDRRVKTTYPDATFSLVSYDELGRRTAETDPAGHATSYEYDATGRLVKVTDARGAATTFAYDELGNRVAQTDANGRTTRFEFDRLGRETRRILPDGAGETRAYDAAGNVTAWTDFLGRTTTYAYDLDNRPLSRTFPDASSVTMTWSPTGRRLSVVDARGTTSWQYDARDRMARRVEPDGRRLDYAYDGAGNVTSVSAQVGGLTLVTTRSYDAAGRLDLVTDPLGRAYDHDHDATGNRGALLLPNGAATAYAYDARNRLTGITTTAPGGAVQSYALTLGPAGQRLRIDELGSVTREYAYDEVYRLTGETVTRGGAGEYDKAFTYDPVGNRLTQATTGTGAPGTPTATDSVAYTYDVRDRLLSENATAYGYDANGNVTAKVGDALYAWDFENRLARVELGDGTVVTHAYDADGLRVRSTLAPPGQPAASTDYLVDGTGALGQVVAESDGAGNLLAYYVRGDDLLALMRPDGGGGWSTRYYHADAVGSVRALTDEAGAVTDTYTYTAFGELIEHAGSDPQPYAFAGEPFDPNSGFAYHRARWMDPRLGRFLSMDPWAGDPYAPSSLHRYTYAGNDPVNLTDPSGLFFFSLGGLLTVALIVGILAGLAAGIYTWIRGGTLGQIALATGLGFLAGALIAATIYGVLWGGTVAYIYVATGGLTASQQIYQAFQRGTVYVSRLTADLPVVRYFSPGGNPAGAWWTTEAGMTSSQAIQRLALPASNAATQVTTGVIPRGTEILTGYAAPLFGQPGGAVQIWLSNPGVVRVISSGPVP